MSPDRSLLLNRRVAAAFLLQVVGYAALLAVYPHSEPSAVAEALWGLLTVVLVVVALPAVPALAVMVVAGALLSLAGLTPEAIPALLFARGDVLFFASAYVVAVGAAWASRYVRKLPSRFEGTS